MSRAQPRVALAAAALVAAPLAAALLLAPRAAPVPFAEEGRNRGGSIAILGDPQETLWLERLFLLREHNQDQSARLVADLARREPDLLVLLGDMVAVGASPFDWKRLDDLLAPLRASGAGVLAVLGNHDYWGGRSLALRLSQERFPQLGRSRWYSRVHGPLGLVFLDSNRSAMGDEAWAEQNEFLSSTLRSMDADEGISGVLVFDHHPPFTNSSTTEDDAAGAELAQPFLGSAKGLAFLSGHAHAYERFHERGRTFVVSGGGGGPRVDLLPASERRHDDLYAGRSPRPFHYLLVETGPRGLVVSVRGFDRGEPEARILDRFELPFPPSRSPGSSAVFSGRRAPRFQSSARDCLPDCTSKHAADR